MADKNEEIESPIKVGASPVPSPLDDLGSSGDGEQALFKGLQELNKMKTKKHKKLVFPGVILSVLPITAEDLRRKTGKSFRNELSLAPNSKVYEYKVYINQLNGSLPILNKSQLEEYNQGLSVNIKVDPQKNPESASKKGYLKFKLYERIINRFHSCYQVVNSDSPQVGSHLMTCKVEFIDENKMFFGKIVKIDSV